MFESGINYYDYRYRNSAPSGGHFYESGEQSKFPFLSWSSIFNRRQHNDITISDLLKFRLSDGFWQTNIIISSNGFFFPENDTLFVHINELDYLSVYLTENELWALEPQSYHARMGRSDMVRINREKIVFKNRESDIVHKTTNKSTGEFLNGLYHITISDNEYCIGLFYNGLPFNFNPHTLNVFEFYRDNNLYKKIIYKFSRKSVFNYVQTYYCIKYEVDLDEPTSIKIYELSHKGAYCNGIIEVTEENKLQELGRGYPD